ncbi:MAG: hypothetical protein HFI50_06300 [Lachnospiraceae bacterium]|jgi:hypothetical protein|nr:hypothetical protein [Lachnospiraceae bacterium]
MNVIPDSGNRRISSMRAVHFASAEDKNTAAAQSSNRDQVTISQEGRDSLEAMMDRTVEQLSAMTKEEFMNMLRQWQSENQPKLEVDPYRKVDPDGSIARKTYFESYLGQLKEMEETVKSYYADAYKEAVSAPINSLAFISGKYLSPWSDYYDPNIPAKERQWTHSQLWAMLTDSNVALNDPYALAASGGTKTVDEMDEIARQAVKDRLDALIKERENTGQS